MRPEQDDFLEQLFREHFNELELYAYRYLKTKDDAQIAVQDAFHIACDKIDDVMSSPNPIGWMKLTIKNIARNMVKAKNRQTKLFISLEEFGGDLSESYIGVDSGTDLLDCCIKAVSKEEFHLFRRIALEGVTYVEAAEELGISMWACRKRVQRTTEKLRKALKEMDVDDQLKK